MSKGHLYGSAWGHMEPCFPSGFSSIQDESNPEDEAVTLQYKPKLKKV